MSSPLTEPYHFVRSHGLGNDYIVVDADHVGFDLTPERVRTLCDRHTGIGSDGIVAISRGGEADFGARIFNPDGSEAEKSGNALRIVAKFLYDHQYTRQRAFTLGVPAGVVATRIDVQQDRVAAIEIDMGRATIDSRLDSLWISESTLAVIPVSLGNPHCVVLCDDLASINLHDLGPKIETHPAFPNRTNVQFAEVLSSEAVRILVWERGAGHTLASGSSACAVAAACVHRRLTGLSVTVHMEGGDLKIDVTEQLDLRMIGPAEEICSGVFSSDLVDRLGLNTLLNSNP